MLKFLYFYITGGALLLIMCSCNNIPKNVKQTLELAGTNKVELQKVIDHYQSPKDSLKLKAAYFLIGNMANKYFYYYNNAQKNLVSFVNKARKENTFDERFDSITLHWEFLKTQYGSNRASAVKDIDIMTSEMLIENIDYAFMAWDKAPWSKEYSFDYFCEYILPYRTDYDIPGLWRKKLHEKFSWVLDSTKNNDFIALSKILKDSLRYAWSGAFEEYANMDILDMEKGRTFACRHHSSLKVAALRSIGVPVAEASGQNGTSWAVVPDRNGKFWGWESQTPPVIGDYIDDLRYENYTKVFESTFKIQPFPFKAIKGSDIPPLFYNRNKRDVTKGQSDAMDVVLELSIDPPKKINYAFLCFFSDKSIQWEAAHWSEIKNNKVTFNQMGLGCIYIPMYYIDRQYYPAGNPIYLNKNSTITNLAMDNNEKEKVKIYRKARPNYWENYYADIMRKDVFEGSNDKNFINAKEIYTIDSMGDHFEERTSKTNQKFRYVRYRSVPVKTAWKYSLSYDVNIAEVSFLGENNENLKGKPLASSKELLKSVEMAFDNDIRTNFKSDTICWIGFDLKKPTTIKKVKYLFTNSFNTVEPGDEYELLYWDAQWKTLGKQLADTDHVTFNVPKNVLLWLKNVTKGKKEHVFFMQNGKQVWSE
ncbi:hypothetical protein [Flavivirga spongiicola]|uniref:Uncharacterized protein n=1 Tax=Flavivirga spongiicola TaxID=421621 RepID=A0ABU7XN87_9FLAO|nr:hypothetical protein [Flavivirga sp. MEBiC05379]MDO5981572.1 hypothetical protein [Flavivirga sp. MEBiC05379]